MDDWLVETNPLTLRRNTIVVIYVFAHDVWMRHGYVNSDEH